MAAALIGFVLGYAALILAACGFQDRLVYFPEVGPGDGVTPALLNLPFEDVKIGTADDESLHAWFVPQAQARATVLLMHGNAGNITHRLPWLPMFRDLRLSALLFDYRGYGESTGVPSEKGTYADADAAWRYLTIEKNIPSDSIIVIGESLGGAIAAHLAAHENAAALVLHSAFTSVPDLASELSPFLPAKLLARFDYNTLAFLSHVRCPVLVAHSRDDDIVPFRHGRRLFDAAGTPKTFIELRGSHNSGFIFVRRVWVHAFDEFITAAIARHSVAHH